MPRLYPRVGIRFTLISFVLAVTNLHGQTQSSQLQSNADSLTSAEVNRIEQQLVELKSSVDQIRSMLQDLQAGRPNLAADRVDSLQSSQRMSLPYIPTFALGSPKAPFVLVEFEDLQCPYCNSFHQRTMGTLQKDFIDTGKVRFLDAQFPLENHPSAPALSIATICAGRFGKYWEMRSALTRPNQREASTAIREASRELGIDVASFRDCQESPLVRKGFNDQVSAAAQAGVFSTPTFLLGTIVGSRIVGYRFVGDYPPQDFSNQLEQLMNMITETAKSKVN